MIKQYIEKARGLVPDCLKFLDAGVSPYHAVKETAYRLESNGYKRLKEEEVWKGKIIPGGKYYSTRGGSSLVAFGCSDNIDKDEVTLKIVGAHTDSPCIRLAPRSKHTTEDY